MVWKATERQRVPYYRMAERIFRKALIEQLKPTIDYFGGGQLNYADAVDLIEAGKIQDAFKYVYENVGTDFAKGEYAKFAGAVNDAMKEQFKGFMDEYVNKTAAKRVTSITGVTKDYAERIIRNVVADAGDVGTDKLGVMIEKELKKAGAKLSTWRARVIARTEVVSAANMGQQIGAEATGQTMTKTWLSTMDNRIRDAHANVNNQTVGMNESFLVGGESLYVPGDANGSAANTVNCRCSVTYDVL